MKAVLFCFLLSLGTAFGAGVPAPRMLDRMPAVSGAFSIHPDGSVQAHDAAGFFYAAQMKERMKRPPEKTLADAPRFEWRGLHVDVSRHFFPPETLRLLMDRMASLRLNRLHLHLTDGPGWRVEIKAYPRLTSEGAWRRKLPPGKHDWCDFELGSRFTELYGGFYTQQELRELVRYAAERHIVIVPEVDMPGHSYAALVAYPELSMLPPGVPVRACQVGKDVLDVRKPEVRKFAETVLTELMGIFPPGTPIHLGGDEVDTRLLSAESQRAFMQHLVDFTKARGYYPITWDEAACNGVRGQWVMLWRPSALPAVRESGLPVILCPCSHFYFDYPQRQADFPNRSGGHVISLRTVRSYPIPQGLPVLGIQANTWSEHIEDAASLFYMIFPRAVALAEKAWGSPERPYDIFLKTAQEWMQSSGTAALQRLP